MRFTRLPISGPPTGWGALPARVAAKPAGSPLRFGIIDAAGEPDGPHAAAAAFGLRLGDQVGAGETLNLLGGRVREGHLHLAVDQA